MIVGKLPVFISHSTRDHAAYSTLCLALDGEGIERYDQLQLVPGESIAEGLRKAIENCELCIFLAN